MIKVVIRLELHYTIELAVVTGSDHGVSDQFHPPPQPPAGLVNMGQGGQHLFAQARHIA